MVLSYTTLLTIATTVVFSKPMMEKRQVRIGVVPIFDSRITNEPITFTFTTARPSMRPITYPVFLDSARIMPTLSPVDHKESLVQTNYHTFNEKWQYTDSHTSKPTQILFTTPMYNQAQYYRAMQAGLISSQSTTTSSPYRTTWMLIGDSWNQMKNTLIASGIEKDWRNLWGKLTGAMEPFMSEFSEQVGRMANTFLKQQRVRFEKEFDRENVNPFRIFREERLEQTNTVPNTNEGANSIKV